MTCLECWRTIESDPLHLDCRGDHFVPDAEAAEIRDWLNGRRRFMVATRQVADDGTSGAMA